MGKNCDCGIMSKSVTLTVDTHGGQKRICRRDKVDKFIELLLNTETGLDTQQIYCFILHLMENLAEDQIQYTFVQFGIHTKTKSVGRICDTIIFGCEVKICQNICANCGLRAICKKCTRDKFCVIV